MKDIAIALKAVIGTVICEPVLLNELKANVNERNVHNITLKTIYKTICHLDDNGYPVDRVSILSNMVSNVDGANQVVSECIGMSDIINFEYHLQIVKNNIIINEVEKMLVETREAISIGSFSSPAELISSVMNRSSDILESSSQKDSVISYKELVPLVTQKIMDQARTGVKDFGHKTGYRDLDDMINGLVPSDLIIVAGRPSMGKTTFAFNIMENIAKEDDGHCLMFSLEMKDQDLVMRSISRFIGETQTNLKKANFTEMSMANLKSNYGEISKLNIHIDPRSSLNVTELRMTAAKVHKKTPLKMIMVDYIQIMNVNDTDISTENRNAALAHITGNLKRLAKDLNVPVVALSQLNRNLEQRADKRPVNSDLKESGAIEQDADVIMFLYRDEIYNQDTQEKGIAEIIIGKQRAGALGTVKTKFNGQYSRFENLSGDESIYETPEPIFTPPVKGYEPDISYGNLQLDGSFDINEIPM